MAKPQPPLTEAEVASFKILRKGTKPHKLTPLTIKAIKQPGLYQDRGGVVGLYLQVTARQSDGVRSIDNGVSKSWLYRYVSPVTGKTRSMALRIHKGARTGTLEFITLADAREEAFKLRLMVRKEKIDPLAEADAKAAAAALVAAKQMTFAQCAAAYIDEHADTWSKTHRTQWASTIGKANDAFGKLAVSNVNTDVVIKFLGPIWKATPETGKRLRGRIEAVLDWATAREFRKGENPARWKGHMKHLLKVGLERRTARSGRDSIDHCPGGHDDVANVVAGVLVELSGAKVKGYTGQQMIAAIMGPDAVPSRDPNLWTPRERLRIFYGF